MSPVRVHLCRTASPFPDWFVIVDGHRALGYCSSKRKAKRVARQFVYAYNLRAQTAADRPFTDRYTVLYPVTTWAAEGG